MPFLQDLIHKLEVGEGGRFIKIGLAVLAVLGGTVFYNYRNFKNMSTQEAMDSAQLARNIAQGKGYTTFFIRPFSMYLLKKHNEAKRGPPEPGKGAEYTGIKDRHPDITNPPVYPFVLAGLMKVLPFEFAIPVTKPKPFWSNNGAFWRYEPDFVISLFNQLLFFGVMVLFFLLARRFFDARTAWLSTILLFTTEQLWRFCVSGLSTMLLLLILMGLVWCLVLIEQRARELTHGQVSLFVLALLAGLFVGAGGLTRYAFGWLIVPVLLFLVIFGGQQRFVLAAIALVVFLGIMTPWVVRNMQVSGNPFGTATYAIIENSAAFPEHRLERSLDPDFSFALIRVLTQKLLLNSRQILSSELPRLGGSWVGAFFLVGLLVNLRQPGASRLRYFVITSLILMVLVQALGRTHLSEDSAEINSENLLVLFLPLALMYGVRLFFVLLDQLDLPFRELRYAAIGLFAGVLSLPMIYSFLPPKNSPIAYPPYYPPSIQSAAGWVTENELTMSDMPWAMAWYGQTQCLWLTLTPQSFLEISDYQKPIQELLLTRVTLDSKLFTQWLIDFEENWSGIVLQARFLYSRNIKDWPRRVTFKVRQPNGAEASFPLRYWQVGWQGLSEQFILTVRENKVAGAEPTTASE